MNVLNIRRGDIFFADLRPVVGSEQGGICHLDDEILLRIDKALCISLALEGEFTGTDRLHKETAIKETAEKEVIR